MKSRNRGFTLIELIIFIVVGAIILPASFVAFTAAIKHFSTPDYYVKARFYAEQKMEELTSNPYCCVCLNYASLGCPAICPTVLDCTVESNYSGWRDSPETNFIRTWEICYVTSSNPDPTIGCSSTYTDYKRIKVNITPPSGPVYTVSTLVTKRPKS